MSLVLVDAPAERLAEARHLEVQGHGIAAVLLARSAIEIALAERLSELGQGYHLAEIHRRADALKVFSDLDTKKGKRVTNVFVAMGSYAHGNVDGPSDAATLLNDADHVLEIIEGC